MKILRMTLAFGGFTMLAGCAVQPIGTSGGYYGGYQAPVGNYYQGGGGYLDYDDYGQPYMMVGGQSALIIFEPNRGWGYYDAHRRWMAAPPHIAGVLEKNHPGGYGFSAPRPAPLGHAQGFEQPHINARPEVGSPPINIRQPSAPMPNIQNERQAPRPSFAPQIQPMAVRPQVAPAAPTIERQRNEAAPRPQGEHRGR